MSRLAVSLLICGAFGAVLSVPTGDQKDGWNNSPIVDYFVKLVRGEQIGALNCKNDRSCGDGMKCDLLLHLCVPLNTPVFRDTEKPCTSDNDCSALHTCILGSCRFCGPRTCKSNLDCCFGGIDNVTFECIDTQKLEKWTVAKELGHISTQMFENMKPHKLSDHDDVEDDEWEALGQSAWGDHVMHGKRCWERCTKDADCALHRIPENMWKDNWGCCQGFCTRRKSCITIPEKMRGIDSKANKNRTPKTTM